MPDLFDVEALLSPLGPDAPCGPELSYDPAFLELEKAGAGKPEQQFGDKVIPAEPPDWPTVMEHALDLAGRTRDLRVAVWLTRAACRLHGLAGAAGGLALVHGLLERQWPLLHPQLDAEDNDDPTMRLNALAPLYYPTALPADLRQAALGPGRGSLTLRELELGLGRAEPEGDEVRTTEAGVLQALSGLLAAHAGLDELLGGVVRHASGIADVVQAAVGMRAPDAAPLLNLLKSLEIGLARARGDAERATGGSSDTAAGEGTAAMGTGGGRGGGTIRGRDDALRELDRVCEWLERNEPSNPAPLLIRRAQRLMKMSFIEIIRDMAASGLDQVETIVGPQGGS